MFNRRMAGAGRRGIRGRSGGGSSAPVVAVKYAFGMAGQSNSVGIDTDLSGLPSPWPPVDTSARLTKYDGTSAVPLVEPVNGTGGTHAISFADAVIRNASFSAATEVAIVPGPPVGGTSIAQWQQGGAYYISLLTRLLAAKAAGYTLGGLIWHQGEDDGKTAPEAAAFPGLTQQFIDDLRADLSEPNFVVLLVVIHPDISIITYPARDTVRAAQRALAATNTLVVDYSAGPMFDGLHMNTLSQMSLGELIAATFIAARGTPPTAPTGPVGARGWTNTNRFESSAGKGVRLSAVTGGFVGLVAHLHTLPTANENVLSTISANTGWGFPALSNGLQLRFRAANAAGSSLINSAIKILSASDVGETHAMLGYVDVSGLLLGFWYDGAAVGAPVVTTGFTPASAAVVEQVGMQGAILPATSWTFCNRIGGTAVPTLGEIAQWFADVRAAADGFAIIPGKTLQADKFGYGTAPNVPLVMDRVAGDGLHLIAGSTDGLTYHDLSGEAWGY